jgi:hypothetical protein
MKHSLRVFRQIPGAKGVSNRLKVAKTMLDECFRFFATVDISRKAVPGTLADYDD